MRGVVVLVLITVAWGKPTGLIHDPMVNEGLFEGDIMVIDSDSVWNIWNDGNNYFNSKDRNAVPKDSMRWPGGVIPFLIHDTVKEFLGDEILEAMDDIMKASCIRFVPRTPEHKHYIRIFRGNGCWSFVGFASKGMQDLSLGYGCGDHSTIIHELMHAIGFAHEHSRSDRDDYLTINYDNIKESWWYAFKKLRPEENRLLTGFDFDSVMLYGQYAFSKQPGELKSMEAKDGRYMPATYDKPGLSKLDIYRLKTLYECK